MLAPMLVVTDGRGQSVVISVDTTSRRLLVNETEDNGELNSIPLHHRILAVFAASDPTVKRSHVYVVVDGPEPVLFVDFMSGTFEPVLFATTLRPFLERGTCDVRLDYMRASPCGGYVAVAHSDGTVVLHKLNGNFHGKPTFKCVDSWEAFELARVKNIVFAGQLDEKTGLPSYMLALMERQHDVPHNKSQTYLTRFSLTPTDFVKTLRVDVGSVVSISSVPDEPDTVALYLQKEGRDEVCYVDISTFASLASLDLDSDSNSNTRLAVAESIRCCTPTLVALHGGERGKYAAVVANGSGHSSLVTSSDEEVQDLDKDTWKPISVGAGHNFALARLAGGPLTFVNTQLQRSPAVLV